MVISGTYNEPTVTKVAHREVNGNTQVSVDKFSGVGYGVLYSSYINLYGNLIAYWKLDGNGDDEMNTYNATAVNGPLSYVSGKQGTCPDLEKDSSHYLTIDNPPDHLTYPAAWTASFWLKPESLSSYSGILGHPDDGSGRGSIIIYSAEICARERNADNSEIVRGNTDLITGQWYHGAVTYSGTTCRIYTNGIQTGIDTSWDGLQEINHIGFSGAGWDGLLDEVMVFDKALSAREIQHLYAEGDATITLNNTLRRKIDLNDACVAHWRMNETSGTNVPDSCGGNNGTTHFMNNNDWVSGVIGNCLDFDGGNDYVDCGLSTTIKPATGDFTCAAWINADSALANWSTFIADRNSGAVGTQEGWSFGLNSTLKLTVILEASDNTVKYYTGPTALDDDTWHHVAFTWDNSADTLLLYTDGARISVTKTNDGDLNGKDISPGNDVNIGFQPIWANFWDGEIEDLRIYNRALTIEEVEFLYGLETSQKEAQGNINIHDSTKPSETHFTRSGQ
jgi:hypothetical protein